MLGAVRARRRGRHLRAVLRLLRAPASRWPAPRGGSSPCGPRTSRLDPDALAAAVGPEDPPGAAQLAAQPDRQGVLGARSSTPSPGCASSTTCWPSPTRSTSTWCSTGATSRWPPCRAWRSARVTISSAGKTFSFTGWKVGWACGPADLVAAVRTAKQFLTYSGGDAVPARAVVALGPASTTTTTTCAEDLASQARPALPAVCSDAGFDVLRPAGTYFATTDVRPLGAARRRRVLPGCRSGSGSWPFPTSVFYDDADAGRTLVRFAFCKRDEVLLRPRPASKGFAARHEGTGMKVAGVQHDIVWEDRPATFARLEPQVAAGRRRRRPAGRADRDVPRRVLDGARADRRARRTARAPSSSAPRPRAPACGCAARCPSAREDGGRPVNRFVLAGPAGELAALRQAPPVHLLPASTSTTRAGTKPASPSTVEGVRVTPFVCYDLRFADQFWAEAAGTDCYVVVANWPAARRAHWQALLVARAIENQAYVVGVNRVGEGGGLAYAGDSAHRRSARRSPRRRRRRRDDPPGRRRPGGGG